MTRVSKIKTILAAGLSGVVLATTVLPAEAGPRYRPYPYYRHNHGWNAGGAVAAGLVTGLAIGALTAPAWANRSSCWVERREVVTPSGRVVLRDFQVCR